MLEIQLCTSQRELRICARCRQAALLVSRQDLAFICLLIGHLQALLELAAASTEHYFRD